MLLLFEQGRDGRLQYRKQPSYHSHILAITFTNKATEEMKRRIIDELNILATTTIKSDFWRDFNQLDDKLHCFADGVLDEAQLRQAAHRALTGLLYDYGTFNVSTIDSFFQSILRNFARELDRDYNYEVQIDSELAMKVAVHNFLLSLGAEARRTGGGLTDVERWVKDHIRQQIDAGSDWNFFKDDGGLLDYGKLMEAELFRKQMPHLHDYLTRVQEGRRVSDFSRVTRFKQLINKQIQQHKDYYCGHLSASMQHMLAEHGIDRTHLWGGRFVANMLKDDNAIAMGKEPKSVLTLNPDFCSKSFKAGYLPPQAFVDDVMEWRKDVIKTYCSWQILEKLSASLGVLALLSKLDDNLKDYSRESNQLLLSDTNDLISRVLESGVPFLYERTGTWINHYMIDEFQDTSRKQYENFRPLLDEALSHTRENLCMLIGDTKQSIYRFRNAEPALFRDQIAKDFAGAGFGLRNETLDTNYRSYPAIIRFNNWLFEQLLQADGLRDSTELRATYGTPHDFQQKLHKDKCPGMVRVQLGDDDKDQVLECLPSFLIELHERFSWGQMGILVSTKSEGQSVVERIMLHNKTAPADRQIAIASDEAMLVANSPSVKRIVSMLRFVDLTQYRPGEDSDDVPEAQQPPTDQTDDNTVVRQRLSDQYLYHVLGLFMQQMAVDGNRDAGQVLADCFEQSRRLNDLPREQQIDVFAAEIDDLLPNRRTELMTLPNIVEHIIAHMLRQTEHPLPDTAHLLAFQDCVNDFASQGGTVREFLAYWDSKRGSLNVPASASSDSINVLTIHKSKGLEFECVVIPFVNWKLQSENQAAVTEPFWVGRDQFVNENGMVIFGNDSGITPDLVPPLLPLNKSKMKLLAQHCDILKGFVDKYSQDLLVDNVNKTYVAFTRPKQELHLFADTSTEVGNLLASILQTGADNPEVDIVRVDENTYQWGAPRDTALDKPGDNKEPMAEVIDMPAHQGASGMASISVRLPEDLSDKQNTGNRLHNLMSRIAYRRDVERAWMFCLNRGILRADDAEWPLERIRAVIDKMFDDPVTRDWFADDNRVYNERNLLSWRKPSEDEKKEKGDTLIATIKRPDRVVCRPDGTWIVVDYKFGEQDRNANQKQVRNYMWRLRCMGARDVRGYLWYVARNEIEEVSLNDRK